MKKTFLNTTFTVLPLLFGVAFLFGCQCDKTKLLNHIWVLEKYGSPAALKTVIPTPPEVTLNVNSANRFNGNDGCNGIFGSCIVADDCTIKFDSMANTLIFCSGAGVMEQADAVKDLLSKVTEYCVSDTELKLCAPDKQVLKYRKK
jgi:heat shock protein HslJ